MESFYFVMPAYNEEENIESAILQWYSVVERVNDLVGCTATLVVANDGSQDETWRIMNSISAKYPCFLPLNKENSGHGATVLFLYRYAIEHGADYIFQTDSDGQTDPEEFWQMFENRRAYDIQIGHRSQREDGLGRVLVAKVLRWVVWLSFHEWVVDANTPFRLMRADRLAEVMKAIPQDFFLCNVAISAIATKWKYRICFYPITFRTRQGGVNSINMKRIFKIGCKAVGDFWNINRSLRKCPD